MRIFYPTFNQQQPDRLMTINAQLSEIEYFCLQRGRYIAEHYKIIAAGVINGQVSQDF